MKKKGGPKGRRPQEPLSEPGALGAAAGVLGVLLVGCLAFTLFHSDSYTATLTHGYTDHLHHPFMTWVAFHRGLDAYRLHFDQAWNGIDFAQRAEFWGEMPLNYPPGILIIFAPLAVIGQYVPMSRLAFAKLGVCWILLLTFAALWAIFLCLRSLRPRWLSWVLATFSVLIMVRLGLEGFYDPVWIGLGAMAVYCGQRKQWERSLLWMNAAAWMHYRAVVFVPLGVYVLWKLLAVKPWRTWPWPTLAVTALSGLACIGSFVLSYPATETYRQLDYYPMFRFGTWAQLTPPIGVSLALAAWAVRRNWILSATVMVCLGLALIDVREWWHASVMMAGLLGATVLSSTDLVLLEPSVLIWWLVMQSHIWGRDLPTAVITRMVRTLAHHRF